MNLSSLETQLQIHPNEENVFTTMHPLWRPSGARGIFGGVTIAQSLKAAQLTVTNDMDAHSMHCYFVSAGSSSIPITYRVEQIRDGRNFSNRSIRAVQGQKTIFLASVSFTRVPERGFVEHAEEMPDVPAPEDDGPGEISSPYINQSVGMVNNTSPNPHEKRIHQWIKAQGTISGENLLAALAFMSDSYFLAAIPHVHNIWHFVDPPLTEFYPIVNSKEHHTHSKVYRPHLDGKSDRPPNRRVGMMVSLDHTIYFHHPRRFNANEWLLSELQTHWAGDGRGIITQKMWTQEGALVATCVQEGIVRLENETKARKSRI